MNKHKERDCIAPKGIEPLGKFSNFIQTFLVIIIIYVNAIPILWFVIPANFVWFSAMLLWIAIILLKRPHFFLKMQTPLLSMILFSIYTICIPYIFGNPTIGNRYVALAQLPFFYLVFLFNEKTINMKVNYKIIKWSIPPILLFTLTTFYILLKNPYASRVVHDARTESASEYLFVGGYDFIYFLAITSVILFALYYFRKYIDASKYTRIGIIFLLLFSIITVLMSNFLTAVLIIIISIFLFLTIKYNILKLLFITPIIIAICVIWSQELISSLIGVFNLISPDGNIVIKLNRLLESHSIINQNSIMSERNETYLSSLYGFAEHPLFGKAVYPFTIEYNFFSGFGQHSQILDTLALYGLFGLIQIYFLIKIFTIRLVKGNRKLNAFTISIMASVFILNIFNNTTALSGFAYFFIFPSAYNYLYMKMNQLY